MGVSRKITSKNGENFVAIPKFWDESMKDGTYQSLGKLTDSENYPGCFGICMNFDEANDLFDYVIAVGAKKSRRRV